MFAKENEVQVKQMKWLGRPKDASLYVSTVIKAATKGEAEKLLCAQFQGKDVTLHGLSLKVSPFEIRWGPVACLNCQSMGTLSGTVATQLDALSALRRGTRSAVPQTSSA